MRRLLAIDVGGTALKAPVLDDRGSMLVESIRVDTPYPCPPEVLIGGGNARKITFALDSHVQIISNQDGILGGFRLWELIQFI